MLTYLADHRRPGWCARCGDAYHDHLVTGATPRQCLDDEGRPLRRVALFRRIALWLGIFSR